ncbi:DNA topoisomerase [Microvirgula aerodenitrificans]|uniref:DNA topoisomerase n=1 Tax=Microvirgula aerodenitrificans TaxID=57480 RepID=UPI00248EEA04|nr:DNA topoisomerase [Microvirgula aerodenitrificans]
MKLMVVESPNKIAKLESILGNGWKVMASVGHIRDLPRSELGIELTDFTLDYEFIPPATFQGRTFPGGEERVARIRKEMRNADMVYLATDPDREGEAIAWHLKETLGLDESEYLRVTFGSITAGAVHKSLEDARKIDYELVYAQEARRALDRIYGWLVSPLVSDRLGMPLSAGRVQSPAVRLVVERERSIRAFRKTSHFGAIVLFDGESWQAEWNTKPFTSEESPYVIDEALAKRAAACRQFIVTASDNSIARQSPPPPFSTSLMLQAASVSLKFDPEVTGKLAQKLFEQGVITYIGTDSVNFSDEGIQEIRAFANKKGWDLPEKPRRFKEKDSAQEGHEAIRPTHLEDEEAGENDQQRALYRLIWQRAIASQLAEATYSVNTVTLEATVGAEKFEFQAKGKVLMSAGWRALTAKDAIDDDDAGSSEGETTGGNVPILDVSSEKQADTGKLQPKVTKPPARYTKASLIKRLETEGLGRPRTYPAIMKNIMEKGYLAEVKRFLEPTEIGALLVDELVKAGFGFIDITFTRGLEEQLDVIAGGNCSYIDVVEPAYAQLQADIEAIGSSGAMKPRFPCPKCGSGLRRYSPAGKTPFWRCMNDECKTFMDDVDNKPLERKTYVCTVCGTGTMRRFKRKTGSGFLWACSTEDCKHFMDDDKGKPVEPTIHPCPKCKAPLRRFQKKDKETGKAKGFGWFCTNAECKTFLDDERGRPAAVKTAPCPACGKLMYRRKGEYGYWWGCSGFRDGCKTIMDDDKGKPVKRGAKKTATKKA